MATPPDKNEQTKVLEPLKNRLLGTWDRRYTAISVLLSVISVALTILTLKYPDKLPLYITIRDVFLALALVSVIMILVFKYARRETSLLRTISQINDEHARQTESLSIQIEQLKQWNSYLSKQFERAHYIVHNYRDKIFQHFQSVIPSDLEFEVAREEYELFQEICSFITNGIKKSFVDHFKSRGIDIGEDISVSVKLIVPSEKVFELFKENANETQRRKIQEKSQWIITAYRDQDTYLNRTEREVARQVYDIEGNTAFWHIIINHQPYFLSNDLGRQNSYINENPTWQKHYNSTLVVPIRYRSLNSDEYICFGLLAVDSLNEKKVELYDDAECRHILAHAADLLANFFLALVLFQFTTPEKNGDS